MTLRGNDLLLTEPSPTFSYLDSSTMGGCSLQGTNLWEGALCRLGSREQGAGQSSPAGAGSRAELTGRRRDMGPSSSRAFSSRCCQRRGLLGPHGPEKPPRLFSALFCASIWFGLLPVPPGSQTSGWVFPETCLSSRGPDGSLRNWVPFARWMPGVRSPAGRAPVAAPAGRRGGSAGREGRPRVCGVL